MVPLRLALSVTCLAVTALALAAPSEARIPRDFVGLTSEDMFWGDPAYRIATGSLQRRLRIGLHRQTFDWKRIERTPGQFTLSQHDDYVANSAARGVRILPVLFNTPDFYVRARRGRASCEPRSNATMARFARVLVRRYGLRGSLWRERSVPKLPIRSWQIWNEPNLGIYSCGRASARRYVRMLRAVGRAIKKVDRKAEIVTAGIPPSKLKSAIRLPRYINRLYKLKGKRYFDTLAINSYARNRKELRLLLRSIRKQMNRHRDRKARIWVTEIGWGDRGIRHRFIVGARGQAARINSSLRFLGRNRKKLRIRGFVYFSWKDAPPYPPLYKNLWGLHTGLINEDGRPKRAFGSFRKAAKRLR